MNEKTRKIIPLLLALIVAAIDQVSKVLVCKYIPEGTIYKVIGNDFIRICHVKNTGIAFGMGAAGSDLVRVVMFILFPSVLIVYFVYLVFTEKEIFTERQKLYSAVVAGGSIGNLIDRIFRFRDGGVVDFISVKFYGIFGMNRWPVFNLGDAFIVVFVLVCMVSMLLTDDKNKKETNGKPGSLPRGK